LKKKKQIGEEDRGGVPGVLRGKDRPEKRSGLPSGKNKIVILELFHYRHIERNCPRDRIKQIIRSFDLPNIGP
jgi:hypothetical protein